MGYSESQLGLLREAEQRMLDAVDGDHADASAALALDSLRLTLLALNEGDHGVEALDEPRWTRLELFGHGIAVGLVGEVLWAGRRWIEVVEPEIVHQFPGEAEPTTFEEKRKLYHPNAVYAVSESTEDEVMEILRPRRGIFAPRGDDAF